LEYLQKKFAGKSELLEGWLKEKKEYLSGSVSTDSLQVVQVLSFFWTQTILRSISKAKIRNQQAFEQQLVIHQSRVQEIAEISSEILSIKQSSSSNEANALKNLEESWEDLKKTCKQRSNALQERLQERLLFEERSAKYAKLAEVLSSFGKKRKRKKEMKELLRCLMSQKALHLWLEKVAGDLAEPIVVNSTKGVLVLLPFSSSFSSLPSSSSSSSLASSLRGVLC
jgi:hypothetical protein